MDRLILWNRYLTIGLFAALLIVIGKSVDVGYKAAHMFGYAVDLNNAVIEKGGRSDVEK